MEFYPSDEEGAGDRPKTVKMYDLMMPVGGMRVKAFTRQEEEQRKRVA